MLRALFCAHASQIAGHRVVLFGSRARGDARERSDFDLGVIGDETIDLHDFYELEDALDALPTLYPCDWVDLCKANESLRANALKEGKVIYEA